MITNNRLSIFEDFKIDNSLIKYRGDKGTSINNLFINNSLGSSAWAVSGESDFESNSNTHPIYDWIIKLKKRILNSFKNSPKITFENLKNNLSTLENFEQDKYEERIKGYKASIDNAKSLGQVSLVEELEDKLGLVHLESVLYGAGITTIITEELVIKFYKESKKGLSLTWIKNYIKTIPSNIAKRKTEVDALRIFDNYVILHFDPKKESYKETKKEIEDRKDPIIFGVIKGSNKLYYLGDWVDEYCDLTLENFIDKFGEEVIYANNITVNIK